MKKGLLVVLAVLISIAFVSAVFAQAPEKKETTTTTTTTTTPEKKVTTTKTTTRKAMTYMGEVMSMDTAANMMTVKGKKGEMTFDVSDAKMAGEVNAGDKVIVRYMKQDGKMVASSVKMGKVKKTTTTTTTTKTKEETTK